MSLLTCKQFLQELNDYLDPSIDPENDKGAGMRLFQFGF